MISETRCYGIFRDDVGISLDGYTEGHVTSTHSQCFVQQIVSRILSGESTVLQGLGRVESVRFQGTPGYPFEIETFPTILQSRLA